MRESRRHFSSALFLRRIRGRRRGRVTRETAHRRQLDHILAMEACVHSSYLLIGYAVELALKAGLTAVYTGCSRRLFRIDMQGRYRHDLVRMADDIDFPMSADQRRQLKYLGRVIVADGRYPPYANTAAEDIVRYNSRAVEFWSDENFRENVKLYRAISRHVFRIDGDERNPSSSYGRRIDADGYVAFRIGGNLRTRITVKYSTKQRQARRNNRRALRRLLRHDLLVTQYWDQAFHRRVKY